MTCEKKCPDCKCNEDQSTKAFREYVEADPATAPSRLESKEYDV
jgi:hypothetical protein